MFVRVEESDLSPIVATHAGNETFAAVLQKAEDPVVLLNVLARYIQFNATFGAGVANLAGEIGVRQDLFRDKSEPLALVADRSMEIASEIFFAAVDEFDDRATRYRDTHRSLAQATLIGSAEYFGFDLATLGGAVTLNRATQDAVAGMCRGYGVGQAMDEAKLFSGIGFHMGSEVLADAEFNLLDNHLCRTFPELVAFLRQEKVELNGEMHDAYFWIQIHTSVEADHFAHAVTAANNALRYYAGDETPETMKSHILAGVAEFAQVQAAFMNGLQDAQ